MTCPYQKVNMSPYMPSMGLRIHPSLPWNKLYAHKDETPVTRTLENAIGGSNSSHSARTLNQANCQKNPHSRKSRRFSLYFARRSANFSLLYSYRTKDRHRNLTPVLRTCIWERCSRSLDRMLRRVHHIDIVRSERHQWEGKQEDYCMRPYHKGVRAIRFRSLCSGDHGGC